MSQDPMKDLKEMKDELSQKIAHEEYTDERVDPEQAERFAQLQHLEQQFKELEKGADEKKPNA